MQPIRLTRAQVREVDRIAIEEYGIPGIVLMENAARQLAEAVHRPGASRRVLVVCGGGNNAGDGYAAARHLGNWGHTVSILALVPIEQLKGDARTMADIAVRCGIPIARDLSVLSREHDVIVDALFGTGLSRTPEGVFADAIALINARPPSTQVIAADVPSGLDCDTGNPFDPCIRADITVTFVAEKVGFPIESARTVLGTVLIADIGAPSVLVDRALRT